MKKNGKVELKCEELLTVTVAMMWITKRKKRDVKQRKDDGVKCGQERRIK